MAKGKIPPQFIKKDKGAPVTAKKPPFPMKKPTVKKK